MNILLEKIEKILFGIDKDEIESSDGFWETSIGVERGKKMIEEIRGLFIEDTFKLHRDFKELPSEQKEQLWYFNNNNNNKMTPEEEEPFTGIPAASVYEKEYWKLKIEIAKLELEYWKNKIKE